MRRSSDFRLAHMLVAIGLVFGCGEDVVEPGTTTGSIALLVTVNTEPAVSAARELTVQTTRETHVKTAASNDGVRLEVGYGTATVQLNPARDSVGGRQKSVSLPPTFNSVQATIIGPSSNPTTRTISLNQSGGFFEATIEDLAPGSYAVSLVGADNGLVTYLGRNANVNVTAGNTTTASVTMNLFVPTLNVIPTPTYLFTFVPTWSSVPSATTYELEVDTDPTFGSPNQFTTSETAFSLFSNGLALFYVRVRAGNDEIPASITAWSDPVTVEIVPGSRPAGSDAGTAPSLGAGPAANGSYDELNIEPGQTDWFAVSLRQGASLSVGVVAQGFTVPSALNATVTIWDDAGNLLATVDDVPPDIRDPRLISLFAPITGTYFIQVAPVEDGQAGTSSAEVGHYQLIVSVNRGATTMGGGEVSSCAIATGNRAYCWGDGSFGQTGDGNASTTSQPVAVTGGRSFVALTSGHRHSCALDAFGAAFCWGENGPGALGDGSGLDQLAPVPVSGGHVFVLLSAGGYHTCGLTLDGETWCWGEGFDGQLGNGGNTDNTTPVLVSDAHVFYTISAANWSTCAIDIANEAWCWGFGLNGELGNGAETSASVPVRVAGGGTYSDISMGSIHACAINMNGAADCWGWQGNAALGNGSTDNNAVTTPVAVLGGLTFQSLDMGGRHSCGVTTGSAVYCWGLNEVGQVGDGTLTFEYTSPVAVVPPGGVTLSRVVAGDRHTCARATSGEIYCWGESSLGQTGIFNTIPNKPQSVFGGNAFISIGTGDQHTCGLNISNAVLCWGNGQFGQNGTGAFNAIVTTPQAITGGLTFSQLAVARNHNCAVEAGTSAAYCWGAGGNGRLGNGAAASSATPVAVAGGVLFNSVATGYFHSCGISTISDLWCWGSNLNGQLGDGSGTDQNAPVAVVGVIADVALGRAHTCALSTGTVFCVGSNSQGQLGNGQAGVNQTSFVAASGGLVFDAVTAGSDHTCGLVAAAAYCWGDNGSGQLGDGTGLDADVPTAVSGGLTFQSIAAGDQHTCGVTLAGATYCWGRGDAAQLGVGTILTEFVPVRLPDGPVDAFAISSGFKHSCALFAQGNAVCWGENAFGQVGINQQGARPSPEIVFGGLSFLGQPGRD